MAEHLEDDRADILSSKSKVSEAAQDLDDQVAALRTRPLNEGPYTFVAADALTMRVTTRRKGSR